MAAPCPNLRYVRNGFPANTKKIFKIVEQSSKIVKMFAVFLLCVLRDYLCLTPAMGCAHTDERTCIRVSTVDVTSSVQAENKCSDVAMWMVRHRRPKLPPPGVLALCQLHRKCLINTLKTVRTRLSRSTSAVVHTTKQLAKQLAKQPGSSPSFGSLYELQTIWTENAVVEVAQWKRHVSWPRHGGCVLSKM